MIVAMLDRLWKRFIHYRERWTRLSRDTVEELNMRCPTVFKRLKIVKKEVDVQMPQEKLTESSGLDRVLICQTL